MYVWLKRTAKPIPFALSILNICILESGRNIIYISCKNYAIGLSSLVKQPANIPRQSTQPELHQKSKSRTPLAINFVIAQNRNMLNICKTILFLSANKAYIGVVSSRKVTSLDIMSRLCKSTQKKIIEYLLSSCSVRDNKTDKR